MPLTRAAPWTADYITALFCLWSSLAGYIHAQRTGEGQSIGNRATAFQPYDTFQAKDGWVVITAVGNVYQRVLPVIGLDPADEKWQSARTDLESIEGIEFDAMLRGWV